MEVPTKYAAIYRRAMTGKSRKAAIRSFCLSCVAWSEAEVRRCTSHTCPLFPYRPKADQPEDPTADDTAPES